MRNGVLTAAAAALALSGCSGAQAGPTGGDLPVEQIKQQPRYQELEADEFEENVLQIVEPGSTHEIPYEDLFGESGSLMRITVTFLPEDHPCPGADKYQEDPQQYRLTVENTSPYDYALWVSDTVEIGAGDYEELGHHFCADVGELENAMGPVLLPGETFELEMAFEGAMLTEEQNFGAIYVQAGAKPDVGGGDYRGSPASSQYWLIYSFAQG